LNSRTDLSQKGSLLVGVLVFSLVLAIGGGAILLLATQSQNIAADSFDEDQKSHAAAGGLTMALAWIRAGGLPGVTTTLNFASIAGYPVDVTIRPGGATTLVRSVVQVPAATAAKPLIWSKISRCEITVPNPKNADAAVLNSIAMVQCYDSTKAFTYP
jgi:Tfp pilus assembly protein PilX